MTAKKKLSVRREAPEHVVRFNFPKESEEQSRRRVRVAERYMLDAYECINKNFPGVDGEGDSFAVRHPELWAAFMLTLERIDQ